MGSELRLPQPRWLGRVDYLKALLLQRRLRTRVLADPARAALLLCSHPPVVTLGQRADRDDLRAAPEDLRRQGVRVYRTERGGRATYHGPGQLVGYPVLSLPAIGLSPSELVRALAGWLAALLSRLDIEVRWDDAAPGLWTPRGKIAAFGMHTHRGVTLHGFALNLLTDPRHEASVDPCGLGARGVTSVQAEQGVRHAPSAIAGRLQEGWGGRLNNVRQPPSKRGTAEEERS
jgi:lipoate-protein ligase B